MMRRKERNGRRRIEGNRDRLDSEKKEGRERDSEEQGYIDLQ